MGVNSNVTDVTVCSVTSNTLCDAQKLCILHNFAPDKLGIFMHVMHENTSHFYMAELLRNLISSVKKIK